MAVGFQRNRKNMTKRSVRKKKIRWFGPNGFEISFARRAGIDTIEPQRRTNQLSNVLGSQYDTGSSFVSGARTRISLRWTVGVMRSAAFLICLWLGPGWLAAADSSQAEFFESKVRPLLAGNCYVCHTEAKSGGLRLDSRESILQGGNSGPAITPGDPDGSLLIQAVSHKHERLRMPPPGKLEPHQIGYLVEWVKGGAVWPVSKREFFAKRIQPLIGQHCLACHGKEPQGGLRLDSRAALLRGGASGAAIVEGKPAESLLIETVRYEHEKIKMPPTGRLPEEAIADLAKWIADGAAWSEALSPPEHYEISAEHRLFWSFQPVRRPPVPEAADPRWGRNPVDRFIASKLADKGLTPGARAGKRTLIRRLTYNLTGLPPARGEIDAFLADGSPRAFEKVVERLLASPHYGERWGS